LPPSINPEGIAAPAAFGHDHTFATLLGITMPAVMVRDLFLVQKP
jgi:hypothetical protein